MSRWDATFLLAFVVYTGIRHVYQKRTAGEEKTERRIDGVEKGLLAFVVLGSLLVPLLYLVAPIFDFADYSLPLYAKLSGVGVAVFALWLFNRSHADLGANWSATLELRRGHELVQQGVYRRMRHPMYAAIFLFGLAQLLLLENWIAGPSALVSFLPLYLVRTPREEAMMHDAFGEAYAEYAARTGRVLPF